MLKDEESHEYPIPVFVGFAQGKRHVSLESGETVNAQNMVVDDGDLEVALGYKPICECAVPAGVKTLMTFYRTNDDASVTAFLLAATDTSIYKYVDSKSPWVQVYTGSTSGVYDYINYQTGMTDLIICGNGSEGTLKWDGLADTFVNLNGKPPQVSSLALHYERVWGTGSKEFPNRVFYSRDLAPEDWDYTQEQGAGFLEIPTWDGGKCIGIGVVADEVIVFKTRNIYRIVGTYPGEFAKYNAYSTTGAIAERSIANNKANAFFLAKDGIYVYNGNSATKISYAVQDVIDTMHKDYANIAVGTVYGDKYILAIPTGENTYNDTIIEYDLKLQNFIVKKGIRVTSFVEYNNKLLFANDASHFVHEYNYGNDFNGADIDAYWETPDTDWGAPHTKKVCSYIYFTARGTGSIKVDAIFNEKGLVKTVSVTKELGPIDKVYKIRLKNKGRRFKFKFSNVDGSYFKVSNVKILMDIDQD